MRIFINIYQHLSTSTSTSTLTSTLTLTRLFSDHRYVDKMHAKQERTYLSLLSNVYIFALDV
jgi:ferric iron reductase protein FhuF